MISRLTLTAASVAVSSRAGKADAQEKSLYERLVFVIDFTTMITDVIGFFAFLRLASWWLNLG